MITEIGRLTNDNELKTIKSGDTESTVLNNRLAIYQGKNRTTFIDITAWGGTAEFMAEHFKKGDEIYIEGELQNKSLPISDDKTINMPFIRIQSVKMVFGRR